MYHDINVCTIAFFLEMFQYNGYRYYKRGNEMHRKGSEAIGMLARHTGVSLCMKSF